ncbi:hypothetical protein [Nitrosomonas sp. Nm58]|uniref:hypothetical protein n=1 Tax=Nitrosomonas sp. Nm58 TaxID=200126 RepID=UPI0015A71F56|nr:hypothetical protein [Nitrosomonas sp. Nm58]
MNNSTASLNIGNAASASKAACFVLQFLAPQLIPPPILQPDRAQFAPNSFPASGDRSSLG